MALPKRMPKMCPRRIAQEPGRNKVACSFVDGYSWGVGPSYGEYLLIINIKNVLKV